MTLAEFQSSPTEPAHLSAPLRALWHDAQDHWDEAHQLVQDDPSRAAAWVHAYLHRKEGDISNARYWYTRAARPEFTGSLEDEWSALVQALLA